MTRFRNMPYLELGTPTRVEYVEAWEAATGVTVSAGDAVVIRTGRWAGRAEVGPWGRGQRGGRAGSRRSFRG